MTDIKSDPRNEDYSNILGGNVLDSSDPFGGQVPTNRQDYGIYRKHYESRIVDLLGSLHTGFIKVVTTCEGRSSNGQPIKLQQNKPGHFGADGVIACDHALHQDPVHPEGVCRIPIIVGGQPHGIYYLCRYCARQMKEKKYPMHKFEDNLRLKCSKCLGEVLEWLDREHPDKLFELGSGSI